MLRANATRKSKRCAASGTWESAGGNNLGFAAATGDYLLLLNNDTEVEDDTLHYSCETLAATPRSAPYARRSGFSLPRGISSSPDIRP